MSGLALTLTVLHSNPLVVGQPENCLMVLPLHFAVDFPVITKEFYIDTVIYDTCNFCYTAYVLTFNKCKHTAANAL